MSPKRRQQLRDAERRYRARQRGEDVPLRCKPRGHAWTLYELLCNTKPAPGGCLEWQGARSSAGYGVVSHKGRLRLVSRLVLALLGKLLLDDRSAVARHEVCSNAACISPDHLAPGTYADNWRDAAVRGRFPSKLTILDVLAIRADPRPLKAISRQYGVSVSAIHSAKTGRTWAHLPGENHAA